MFEKGTNGGDVEDFYRLLFVKPFEMMVKYAEDVKNHQMVYN